MRRMRWAPIVIASAMLLAVPGQALASSIAPPGKAGANQYFETIPTSAGNAAPPQGGASNSHALSHLGQGRAGDARLSHLGKTGAAAAALVAASAPTKASNAAVGGASGSHGTGPAASGAQTAGGAQNVVSQPAGQSPVSALVSALGGSDTGGLGLVLPLALVSVLIAALLIALLALRRRDRPTA